MDRIRRSSLIVELNCSRSCIGEQLLFVEIVRIELYTSAKNMKRSTIEKNRKLQVNSSPFSSGIEMANKFCFWSFTRCKFPEKKSLYLCECGTFVSDVNWENCWVEQCYYLGKFHVTNLLARCACRCKLPAIHQSVYHAHIFRPQFYLPPPLSLHFCSHIQNFPFLGTTPVKTAVRTFPLHKLNKQFFARCHQHMYGNFIMSFQYMHHSGITCNVNFDILFFCRYFDATNGAGM